MVTSTNGLFEGVPSSFMVEYISKWRSNPFNCNFKVLAHTALGPSAIEFQNIVSVQFKINSKYSATVKILENYVHRTLQNLFVDKRSGKMESFIHREDYDKPSLSVPLRKIDNLDCPLPKIQLSIRPTRTSINGRTTAREKVFSTSQKENVEGELISKVDDWWEGPRISVQSKKPLFLSRIYKTIRQESILKSSFKQELISSMTSG